MQLLPGGQTLVNIMAHAATAATLPLWPLPVCRRLTFYWVWRLQEVAPAHLAGGAVHAKLLCGQMVCQAAWRAYSSDDQEVL